MPRMHLAGLFGRKGLHKSHIENRDLGVRSETVGGGSSPVRPLAPSNSNAGYYVVYMFDDLSTAALLTYVVMRMVVANRGKGSEGQTLARGPSLIHTLRCANMAADKPPCPGQQMIS